jgi:hypothetical protein
MHAKTARMQNKPRRHEVRDEKKDASAKKVDSFLTAIILSFFVSFVPLRFNRTAFRLSLLSLECTFNIFRAGLYIAPMPSYLGGVEACVGGRQPEFLVADEQGIRCESGTAPPL